MYLKLLECPLNVFKVQYQKRNCSGIFYIYWLIGALLEVFLSKIVCLWITHAQRGGASAPAQLTADQQRKREVKMMADSDSADVALIGNTDLTSSESENNIVNTVILFRLNKLYFKHEITTICSFHKQAKVVS